MGLHETQIRVIDWNATLITLGHLGRHADTNIALTAVESLFWSVSDSIRAKRKDVEKEPDLDVLAVGDPAAIGSIFTYVLVASIMRLRTLPRAWDVAPALRCLDKALRALKAGLGQAELKEKTMEAAERAWLVCDEMGGAVVQSASVSAAKSQGAPPFTQESLMAYVDVIQSTRSLSRSLSETEWDLERITRLMVVLKGTLTYSHSPDYRPDIDSLSPVQTVVVDTVNGIELQAPGVPSLVLKEISEYTHLCFSHSSTPDLSPPAPFLISTSTASGSRVPPPGRVTYIALTKKCMPMLVDLFLQFKDRGEIYVNGTLEAVLWAYAIPMKLKYDCPPASKFGKDPPLWKSATTNFLRIVNQIAPQLTKLHEDIPDERVEGIWRQTIDVFRGAILADCAAADSQPFDVQEAEEDFDLSLIASLEVDVVPHLGDPRISDYVITQLAKILQHGSHLREQEPDDDYLYTPVMSAKTPVDSKGKSWANGATTRLDAGSTEPGTPVSRERFSYWCFDLLFLICSDASRDYEESRKRVAALSISLLLSRCRSTLARYVADESLRGNLPFPRVREEELVYILHKLQELKLWPGSLWAALSDDPSKYSLQQSSATAIDPLLPPQELIADTVKRSSRAHLFHLYTIICEIASVPHKAPSAWIMMNDVHPPLPMPGSSTDSSGMSMKSRVVQQKLGSNQLVKMDAQLLALGCLKEIGKEMGIPA
ncbi:hypothetical protein EVG20_g1792 [Dentipellis fragilis]|uniref:Uncharacterized protein n=1 Tax=Dentipellis fragilis TaxID=205917 RepID=A0A4Y9ZBN9_9AGAM|nr:hypothetical protein EVG20_g1792 [Dentipellis fragilis]